MQGPVSFSDMGIRALNRLRVLQYRRLPTGECMCVCMHVCVHACVHVYVSVCVCTCGCVRFYVCVCVCGSNAVNHITTYTILRVSHFY